MAPPDAETLPLSTLIQQILPSLLSTNIFSASNPPTLLKNSKNSILYYRGTCKPPHRDHLTCLTHAFHRASSSLNIIAAIVNYVPNAQQDAKYAYQGRSDDVLFDHSERVVLWNDAATRPDWMWAVPDDKCRALRQRIVEVARETGFEIEWVNLFRLDYPLEGDTPHSFAGCAVVCGPLSRLTEKGITAGCRDWGVSVGELEHMAWVPGFVAGVGDEAQVGRLLDELFPEQEYERRSGKSARSY